MKISILKLLAFLNFSLCLSQSSENIITFFLQPLPKKILKTKKLDIEKTESKISKPEKLLKTLMVKDLNQQQPQSGIYVLYTGSSILTGLDGQVTFLRKMVEPSIHILITQDIVPSSEPTRPEAKNLIRGFFVNPKAMSQYYLIERKFNLETEQYAWHIIEQDIPKNLISAHDTIIILANPKNIILPTGSLLTGPSENLILPNIYVIKNPDSILNALRFMKKRQYFSPVNFQHQLKNQAIQSRITNS